MTYGRGCRNDLPSSVLAIIFITLTVVKSRPDFWRYLEIQTVIYALNVYDIVAGKESLYASYAAQAAAVAETIDVKFIAAGDKTLREIAGQSRSHFALVKFADLETFDFFMRKLDENDLHRLREEATENYIWTLYDPWKFGN